MQSKFNKLYLNSIFPLYRVGKTSLLNQYIKKEFSPKYDSTSGADFLIKKIYIGGNMVKLQLWDTAGAYKSPPLSDFLYRDTKCCALVFDLTDSKSFENIESWRAKFLKESNIKDPDAFPFVLIGNKCDKVAERKVEEFEVKQYCKTKSNMSYFETSCKDNINVDTAFEEVANLALMRASKE